MAVEGLSARLYLDTMVNPRLATDLRRHDYDVVVAKEVGNRVASDETHLQWATADRRVVITFDRVDYPIIATRWFHEGRDHAGIIIAVAPPRLPYGELLRRLLGLLDRLSADQLVNQVLWLDESWRS